MYDILTADQRERAIHDSLTDDLISLIYVVAREGVGHCQTCRDLADMIKVHAHDL